MKLTKLSMPAKGMQKKQKADELMSDLMGSDEAEASGDMASEMAGESEGETGSSEDESSPEDMSEDSSELSSIPDKDLMAELRKRGLLNKAMSASSKPSSDEQY